MRQTELQLTDEDRVVIDEIRSKGVHTSREVNRAHVRIPIKPATDSILRPATGNALNPATQNALKPASRSALESATLGS